MASYGTLGGLSKPCQQLMDDLGDEALITRQFNTLEVLGIEAKNTYHYYADKQIEATLAGATGPKATPVAITVEDSGTCERVVMAGGRSLTFTTHLGAAPGKGDSKDVAYKVKKHMHFPCCPLCSRPSAEILDANGTLLGKYEDPCMFNCTIKNEMYDHQGTLRFQTVQSYCQIGQCFPCCGKLVKDVQTNAGQQVGKVTRLTMGIGDLFGSATKQRVAFPKAFDSLDRVLLLAAMTISDAVYFTGGEGATV